MSAPKRIVNEYTEGFRRSDHGQILSCPTDDIVWELHGHKTLRGKDAFDGDDLHNVGFFFFSDPDGNSWSVQQISSHG